MSYNLNGTEYDENSYNSPDSEDISSSSGNDPQPEESGADNNYSCNYEQSSYNNTDTNNYNSSYNNGSYNNGYNYNSGYNNSNYSGPGYSNSNYNGSNYNGSNYNGYNYSGSSYGTPQEPKTTNGFGIAGFVISLVGMLLACCFPIFGLITGFLGIVFCIIGVNKKYNVRGLAIAGIVLSVICFLFSGFGFLLESDDFNDALDQILEEEEEYLSDYYGDDFDMDEFLDESGYSSDPDEYYNSILDEYDSLSLGEKVIFDQNDIKITANNIIYCTAGDDIYPYIGLTVENNSAQDIEIETELATINGISMYYYSSDSVDAGTTANIILETYTYDFTYVGYKEVGSLQLQLNIYDDDTYEDIATGDVYDVYLADGFTNFSIDQLEIEAVPLKSNNGITLYYVEATDIEGDDCIDFMFYVENDSDETISVDMDDLIVNDESQFDYDFTQVYPHSGYFINLYCDDDTYTVSNISSASVDVNIYNATTYEDYIETETITFINQQ